MKRAVKAFAATTMVCGITACSGGGSDGGQAPFQGEELNDLFVAFGTTYGDDIQNERFFDPADFAADGEATYTGAIGIVEAAGRDSSIPITDTRYVSPIVFDINLGNGEMTGRADAFTEPATEATVGGSVTINANLNRVDPTGFGTTGRLDGSLDLPDGQRAELDGDFAGDFFGETGAGLDGDSDGTFDVFDTSGERSDTDSFAYDADIIAERDGG